MEDFCHHHRYSTNENFRSIPHSLQTEKSFGDGNDSIIHIRNEQIKFYTRSQLE